MRRMMFASRVQVLCLVAEALHGMRGGRNWLRGPVFPCKCSKCVENNTGQGEAQAGCRTSCLLRRSCYGHEAETYEKAVRTDRGRIKEAAQKSFQIISGVSGNLIRVKLSFVTP